MDPEYEKTGGLTDKSDVFSFGVVLFEVLFGTEASIQSDDDLYFVRLARSHYEERKLDELIDPDLRKQMNLGSLNIFAETAYYCVKEKRSQRQNMNQVVSKLEEALKLQLKHEEDPTAADQSALLSNHLKDYKANLSVHYDDSQMTNKNNLRISLEAITSGTQNFSHCNCIGEGRFWKLYKGEVELADGRCTSVLAKRWDTKYNKGNIQFSNELYILSRYKHESIIGLVGYCNEGNEKIIVYKNASNGILDKHMGDPSLTWTKRLNISIGIAKGLSFLHQGGVDEEDNPIKHRDIRCGSILLDDNWNAKICNFEMSSKAFLNMKSGYLEDVACNPLANIFQESDRQVPKNKDMGKSDIYSLGLILIDMIFEGIKDQIGEIEATKFDAIAISCLEHYNCKCSPDAAGRIVTRLENLLEFKKLHMSLKAINLATQNFSECNCVGEGRFWKSYEGKVEDANGCTRVIIVKRWDKMFDEADILVLRELHMLSEYKHRNIIRLLGYCDEDNEKIIIYEHARNGSLDKHLGDPSLTWKKRLNIGIGVAEALSFLDHRSINFGGVRSGSILLDGNWNAKISNIDGYVDPENQNPEDRKLYSLGVILTEMLCGRLAWPTKDHSQSLGYLASSCYSLKGNIDDMIFEGIKEQIDPQSLAMFQATAIKCLDEQDMGDYSTRFYTIASELEMALRSQFYSIGINGEGNELISARKFSYKNPSLHKFRSVKGSR
ncbi:hypothetical protein QVD17_35400 [Tagetes erecta]|uniref:Protein kinase domain-containing protein n=1 Tax=Tagetes erecta TaxID=13708 RepID=A0AAD8K0W7_TARER|nr:hypothetical protein QVD17_35400 [Tagetes erecta]